MGFSSKRRTKAVGSTLGMRMSKRVLSKDESTETGDGSIIKGLGIRNRTW